ncbi:hypothetical protein BDZ97DRAFT_1922289 [Flammula alnicola]|nr:hypothetical protein BDZ97DRAFT_1922289 [Flammula alnicola]
MDDLPCLHVSDYGIIADHSPYNDIDPDTAEGQIVDTLDKASEGELTSPSNAAAHKVARTTADRPFAACSINNYSFTVYSIEAPPLTASFLDPRSSPSNTTTDSTEVHTLHICTSYFDSTMECSLHSDIDSDTAEGHIMGIAQHKNSALQPSTTAQENARPTEGPTLAQAEAESASQLSVATLETARAVLESLFGPRSIASRPRRLLPTRFPLNRPPTPPIHCAPMPNPRIKPPRVFTLEPPIYPTRASMLELLLSSSLLQTPLSSKSRAYALSSIDEFSIELLQPESVESSSMHLDSPYIPTSNICSVLALTIHPSESPSFTSSMPSSPLSNQDNTAGAFVTSSMSSSPLSNQGNTAEASVKLEESMSPSLSSHMSETPQVLTLTQSAIALPDIQEILRSSTLQKPVSNDSDSPNIPKASPLLLSTPINKAKHLLDMPPGLAPPKCLCLHNAIPATPYTLFNHAPLIITLPSLSNNDLYFPLPSMQLEFIEDVISLLRGQHSQCDGLLIPHELLTYQMKFTVNKNADPVYRFPLIESLFALAVFWFAEEHFPDSDSDEPSHLHYLQRQPVYDNTSSDMDNFLDSDSDSCWDSLSTSETLSSSSSDSPKLSLLELEFKDGKAPVGLLFNEYVTVSPSDTQANLSRPPSSNPIVAIKSESPPPSLDYPYNSDTFAEHEGHSLVIGIITYRPFPLVPTSESYSSSQLLLAHTYRAHFISTDELDARENFIYEGADSLTYQQDFNLDLPAPLKDPLPDDFTLFIQCFEQYLQEYLPEKYGIELPLSVLDDRELCGYDQTGEPLYCFKGAEKLIATAVSRIRSKKLHRRLPTTPPDYGDLSYLLINHKNDVEFVPPQIPYHRVIFSDDESRDERDDDSTFYYCRMLGRCEAFASTTIGLLFMTLSLTWPLPRLNFSYSMPIPDLRDSQTNQHLTGTAFFSLEIP